MRKNNSMLKELEGFLYLYTDEAGKDHLLLKDPAELKEGDNLSDFETDFVTRILSRSGSNYTDKNHPIRVQVQFKYADKVTELPLMYIRTTKGGVGHLFTAHPRNMPDAHANKFIVKFNEHILRFVGEEATAENPVKIRVRFCRGAESKPFNLTDAAAIRNGMKNAHVEDGEGAVVLIQEGNRQDENGFVLVGEVCDPNIRAHVDWRAYSIQGVCSDNKPEHDLEIVAGYAFNEQPKPIVKPEGIAAAVKTAEGNAVAKAVGQVIEEERI